jgi:hypothetical protein
MTAENLESVKRRVQKLLAIAEHERSNPNEAAAAAGMAEKIMRKYQLDCADVIMAALKKGDDLSTEDIVCTAKTNGTKTKTVSLWVGMLAVAVAELNECGCKEGWTSDFEACVRFFGYTADVQLASWTLGYLVETTNRLCNEYKKTEEYLVGGRRVLNAYRQGVSIGITQSLKKLAAMKTTEVQTSTGTSLMVVKQGAIAAKYGEFKTRSTKTKVNRGASFFCGLEDGRKVNVDQRPLTASATPQLS